DRNTRSAIERASLDFMRKTVRRLREPGEEAVIDEALIDAQNRQETLLDAVLTALRADGDVLGGAATEAAEAAKDAIRCVLDRGYDHHRLQVELDWWSQATGGKATIAIESPTVRS